MTYIPHAEVLRAYADGKKIEWYNHNTQSWCPVDATNNPISRPTYEWHVAPEKKPLQPWQQKLVDAALSGRIIELMSDDGETVLDVSTIMGDPEGYHFHESFSEKDFRIRPLPNRVFIGVIYERNQHTACTPSSRIIKVELDAETDEVVSAVVEESK